MCVRYKLFFFRKNPALKYFKINFNQKFTNYVTILENSKPYTEIYIVIEVLCSAEQSDWYMYISNHDKADIRTM